MKKFKIGVDTGFVGGDYEENVKAETREEALEMAETLMYNHISYYAIEVDENGEEIE